MIIATFHTNVLKSIEVPLDINLTRVRVSKRLALDGKDALGEVGSLLGGLDGLLGGLSGAQSTADSTSLLLPKIKGQLATFASVVLAKSILRLLVHDCEGAGDVLADSPNTSHTGIGVATSVLPYAELRKVALESLELLLELAHRL